VSGAPLAATFAILDVGGNALVPSVTVSTNASGTSPDTKLPVGTYLVHETVTPEGYAPSADQTLVITPADTAAHVQQKTIYNMKKDTVVGYLQIHKFDRESPAVGLSATFDVRRAGASPTGISITTDPVTGYSEPVALPVGDYLLLETAVKAGYERITTDIPVTISAENTSTAPLVIEIPNSKISVYGQFSIVKIDSENANLTLPDAVFDVYGSEADSRAQTNKLGSITTDANGYASASGFVLDPDGSAKQLWLVEVKAPTGYVKNSGATIVWATVDGTGPFSLNVNIPNTKISVPPGNTPGPTDSPARTPRPTSTPKATPTPVPMDDVTPKPSETPLPDVTGTPKPTPEFTPTIKPTATPTATPTAGEAVITPAETPSPVQEAALAQIEQRARDTNPAGYVSGGYVETVPPMPMIFNDEILPIVGGAFVEVADDGTEVGTWEFIGGAWTFTAEPIPSGKSNPKTGDAHALPLIALGIVLAIGSESAVIVKIRRMKMRRLNRK